MSKKEKRVYKISIRVSPTEREKLNQIREKLNITISELFRTWLEDATKMIDYVLLRCKYYRKIFVELNKIGNNINQIARKVNANDKVSLAILKELEKIYEEMKEIRRQMGGLGAKPPRKAPINGNNK